MEKEITILDGYKDMEKGAYLGAIASLASADRAASEQELEYLEMLIKAANISEQQSELIRKAALLPIADKDLLRFLDVLKSSDLRHSLVSDVIAFAEADKNYTSEEKEKVEQIAIYLGVNHEQYSLLDQFTKKAVDEAPKHMEDLQSEKSSPMGFLDSLGFGDKMKSAGINTTSLMKGALGIIGPLLLAKMLSGGRRNSGGELMGGGGGLLGAGMLGGLMGGGGLLGGLLGGGRGFGSAGGMLGRLFGGKRY